MELRHLRYFVAVATEEHMRKAAAKLHVAQPAVTRQIADLEQEIGSSLFERLPRGIRLNAAGTVLLQEAKAILTRVDEAVAMAQRAARGQEGYLRLGFMESASWMGAFPKAVQTYRTMSPRVVLEFVPLFSQLQLSAIQDEQLDAGFCYVFENLPRGLSSIRLRTDRVLLAVPRSYGWKGRKDLRLADLKHEAFVGIQRSSAPLYIDRLMKSILLGGLSPRIVQEAIDETTMLCLVSAGVGLGFVNSANEARRPQFVDFVAVQDLAFHLPLHFVWKKENTTVALTHFRAIVERYVEN